MLCIRLRTVLHYPGSAEWFRTVPMAPDSFNTTVWQWLEHSVWQTDNHKVCAVSMHWVAVLLECENWRHIYTTWRYVWYVQMYTGLWIFLNPFHTLIFHPIPQFFFNFSLTPPSSAYFVPNFIPTPQFSEFPTLSQNPCSLIQHTMWICVWYVWIRGLNGAVIISRPHSYSYFIPTHNLLKIFPNPTYTDILSPTPQFSEFPVQSQTRVYSSSLSVIYLYSPTVRNCKWLHQKPILKP